MADKKNDRLLTQERYNKLSDQDKKRAVKLNGGYYVLYPLELSQEKFNLSKELHDGKDSIQETSRDNAAKQLDSEAVSNHFFKKNEQMTTFLQNAGSILDKDWRLFKYASTEMDWVKKSMNALNNVLSEGITPYFNNDGTFRVKEYSARINAAYDEFIAAAQNYAESRNPSSIPGKRRKRQVTALLKQAKEAKRDFKITTDALQEKAIDFAKMSKEDKKKLNSFNLAQKISHSEAEPLTVEWQNQGNSTDVYRLRLKGSDGNFYYLKENLPFLNENIEGFLKRRTSQLKASFDFSQQSDPKLKKKAEERLSKLTAKDYQSGIKFLENLTKEINKADDAQRTATETKVADYFAHNYDDIFRRLEVHNMAVKFVKDGGNLEQELLATTDKKSIKYQALLYAIDVKKGKGNGADGEKKAEELKEMTATEWLQKELNLDPKNDKVFLDSLKGLSTQEVTTLFRVTMGKEVELFGQMSAQKKQDANDIAAINNTATSRVAEALGFDDVITKSRTEMVTFTRRDGTEVSQLCTLTEEAPGTELVDLMKQAEKEGKKLVYSSEAIRNLMRLQAIDTLCLQKDRHGRNFKCVTEEDPSNKTIIIKSIKAYDNDMSFDAITLAEAFKDGEKKVQFLPNMFTKVEKDSALYKHVLGTYFGVDVMSAEKIPEVPDFKISNINEALTGKYLGYGQYCLWTDKNFQSTLRFSAKDVEIRGELSDEKINSIKNEMETMGIKPELENGALTKDDIQSYALNKLQNLSQKIQEVWMKKLPEDEKPIKYRFEFHKCLKTNLSPEEKEKFDKAVEELRELQKNFDFAKIRVSMVNPQPAIDLFIKSTIYLHDLSFGETAESRFYRMAKEKDPEALKVLLDSKGNLELPAMLHFDADAHRALQQKVKDYENPASLAYKNLKETGLSDEKIQAMAARNREMLQNLTVMERKAKVFYKLAGWTEKPQNSFFLEKEDYKNLTKLTDFAVNPADTYLAVDNENYLVGQKFTMNVNGKQKQVAYTELMDQNEKDAADNYNAYIQNDDKRWKYTDAEKLKKTKEVSNTDNKIPDSYDGKEYIRAHKEDVIYAISHRPINSLEDFKNKMWEALTLSSLSSNVDRYKPPFSVESAKEVMKPDSNARKALQDTLNSDIGKEYKANMDKFINQLYEKGEFKKFDSVSFHRLNEMCIEKVMDDIFKKLGKPNADIDAVISLGQNAEKLAKNWGADVKASEEFKKYLHKNPQAGISDDVKQQVINGLNKKPEAPEAGNLQIQNNAQMNHGENPQLQGPGVKVNNPQGPAQNGPVPPKGPVAGGPGMN